MTLTDYLSGDTYFRTSRPGQNLDRACNQFKLVSDMEKQLDGMRAIVKKYSEKSAIKEKKFLSGFSAQELFSFVLYDISLLYSYGNLGSVVVIGGYGSYFIYRFNTGDYFSKCSILTVKMGRVRMHDEKL